MLLRAIGVPFDAHEIDKGVMLGSVEVLRSLEEARRSPPPEGGKNEIPPPERAENNKIPPPEGGNNKIKDTHGQPISAESQRSR